MSYLKWVCPQAPIPTENRCIPIYIPDDDEWEELLRGAIDALTNQSSWLENAGSVSPYEMAQKWQKILTATVGERCEEMTYPRRAFIPGSLAQKWAGTGTITTEFGSTFMLGQRTILSGYAVGSVWRYEFELAAGRYEMRHVIQRVNSANGCITDWKLDGDLILDNLTFVGSATNLQVNTTVDVLESGQHVLDAEVVSITGTNTPPSIMYIQFVPNVAPG